MLPILELPRTAREQFNYGVENKKNYLICQFGDLIFFHT
jgi:cell wall-associated NlpC family hydrolase